MAILPTDQRSQIMALLVLVAGAGGYFFWTKLHTPDITRVTAANQESDSLEKIVAAAKADLASGSIEDLRRRVEEYQGSLELMRRSEERRVGKECRLRGWPDDVKKTRERNGSGA